MAATHSPSPARLSGEPERELSTGVFFVEQSHGRPQRGDCSQQVTEQLVSRDHADLSPVIGQSALATLGTLEEDLTDDRGKLRAHVLIIPAHGRDLSMR